MSTTTFIDSVTNLPLSPTTLKSSTSRASFPKFYSPAFPIFSLHPSISASDLTSAITQINQQACTELTFLPEQLAEAGLAAALPTLWQMHNRDPAGAVTWFLDDVEKGSADEPADPKWYPHGFIGVDNVEWRKKGVGIAFIYFDMQGQGTESERVDVKAFRVDAEKLGLR